jgi:hypothetical protein
MPIASNAPTRHRHIGNHANSEPSYPEPLIERKHGVFPSIKMLTGFLIFPDWHAN